MAQHKHYDCIIAWANGAEIEFKNINGDWDIAAFPTWHVDKVYRVRNSNLDIKLSLNSDEAYGLFRLLLSAVDSMGTKQHKLAYNKFLEKGGLIEVLRHYLGEPHELI